MKFKINLVVDVIFLGSFLIIMYLWLGLGYSIKSSNLLKFMIAIYSSFGILFLYNTNNINKKKNRSK